jgi:hypothetical protein
MKTLTKKGFKGYLLLTLLFSLNYSFSQTYEEMPDECKAKMDWNKMQGIDLLDGIKATHSVSTLGLDESEYSTLQTRAEEISAIQKVTFKMNGVVEVECDASVRFEVVKPIFSELVSNITGIQTTYSLKENN